jgi:hypothetical protein
MQISLFFAVRKYTEAIFFLNPEQIKKIVFSMASLFAITQYIKIFTF